MAKLCGDDDHLYEAYLKWKRRPLFPWELIMFLVLIIFSLIVYLLLGA